ncbi:hypothetical protein ABW19_dt0203469 [Dactylella cylindrospora]|nr:hypothetical protein ABW19_dt0203469 [Dactylella cylindrospora]
MADMQDTIIRAEYRCLYHILQQLRVKFGPLLVLGRSLPAPDTLSTDFHDQQIVNLRLAQEILRIVNENASHRQAQDSRLHNLELEINALRHQENTISSRLATYNYLSKNKMARKKNRAAKDPIHTIHPCYQQVVLDRDLRWMLPSDFPRTLGEFNRLDAAEVRYLAKFYELKLDDDDNDIIEQHVPDIKRELEIHLNISTSSHPL